MLQIPSIRVESLANADHYKFHADVLKLAKADATIKEKAAELLAKYETAFQEEDECYRISQKSKDTAAISAADRKRDSIYNVLKKNVTSFSKIDDAELSAAGATLLQMLTDYNLSVDDNLNRESGKLLNIIDDCEKKYSAEVEKLGLGVIISTLKSANNEVVTLMDGRADEQTQKKAGALRESRAKVDEIFRALIQLVNALIVVFGETDYADFAEHLTTVVNYYKRYSLGEATSSTSSSTNDAEDNSSSTDDDSSSSTDDNSGSDSGDSGSDGGSDSGSDSGSDGDDSDVKF